MAELLLKQEVYRVVGCAMQVYNTLKSGFLEAVYQEALEIEFADQEVPAIAQASVRILYK
ncbi:MAG: GxxExxY protein [Planctomycetes bacterium]|nr:GxxExxY protein [Planctomycetota bacterium]